MGVGKLLNPDKTTRLTLLLTALLAFSLFLGGCAVKSGLREFEKAEAPQVRNAPEAPDRLARAFENSVKNGGKFRFTGWGVTKVQKRKTDFYTTGSYDKEKGYLLDVQVFGHRYRYYRWGNDVYISEKAKWRKIEPTENPREPFLDFEGLLPVADKAVRLPDGEVLGKKCYVYQIHLNSEDALRVAESIGIQILPGNAGTAKQYFDGLEMKFTVWIGKDEKNGENFIYQYKTETTMPVPKAGSLYQEVFYKFYDYNSRTLNIPAPEEKITPYLVRE